MPISQLLEQITQEEYEWMLEMVSRRSLPDIRNYEMLYYGNLLSGAAVGVKSKDIEKIYRFNNGK